MLPKGHIEWGESAKETAVREIREESGYWAEVGRQLGDNQQFRDGSSALLVRFFLMRLVPEDKAPPQENRERIWLALPEAQKKAGFDDTRKLLALANQCIDQWDSPDPCQETAEKPAS